MHVTNKNSYSECYEKVLYGGRKSARNILKNLIPNLARSKKSGPTYNSGGESSDDKQFFVQFTTSKRYGKHLFV